MTVSLSAASLPIFTQMLNALGEILAKAEAHAKAISIEPEALLQARLFPDMFPLLRQVQIAADFAKSVPARLAGQEVPAWDDGEQSFAELRERIARTLQFIGTIDPAQIDAGGEREIVLRPGTPKEKRLIGRTYLLHYGLPQFFFHVTTAYDILRHNGVNLGKRDYMGAY